MSQSNSVSEVKRLENSPPVPAESGTPLDPFDPARLRLGQDFASSLGIKKKLLTVPVRKPGKAEFVRVHSSPEYRLDMAILDMKDERETYLIDSSIRDELTTEPTFGVRAFFTAITRQGVLFLWPVRLPAADGKLDDWSRSAMEAALMSMNRWVRVTSNMALGAYEVFEASASIPEPKWPDLTFRDILAIAFKDHLIDSLDHPVLQKLRGEV